MQAFEANYYDGISPLSQRGLVTIADTFLVLDFTDTDENTRQQIPDQIITKQLRFLIADCHIQAKLGSGKRLIDLPDGSRLETDFQNIEMYLPEQGHNMFWRVLHYAETHPSVIAISLLMIVLVSVLILRYGVPVMAKYVALATPPTIEKNLGRQTLETLDYKKLGYFEATNVSLEKQKTIQAALEKMCKKTGECANYSLNFRKSDLIGANAFALPGGFVVVTDDLVKLAENDDEIVAVLAHELGHVKGRHAFRQMLQGTISGLVIIAITGDVSSIASGLPAFMLNVRYTRDLETEADQYALQSLKKACIPTQSYANILLRLEKTMRGTAPPEIISSHPDTKTRILLFLQDHRQCL